MRQFLNAFLLAVLPMSQPAAAEPMPQGDFLLGNYIWPERVAPRYLTLQIKDDRIALLYSSPAALNPAKCDETGECIFASVGATASAEVIAGLVSLSGIVIDESAPISPDQESHFGRSDKEVYVVPVLDLAVGAVMSETAYGFRLTNGSRTLDFYAVPDGAWQVMGGYAEGMAQSIYSMAGCEVRALAPLLNKPAPTSAKARFLNALDVVRIGWQLYAESRRLSPSGQAPTAEQRKAADYLMRTRALPGLIASLSEKDTDPDYDLFWKMHGKSIYKGDRKAYDADLLRYGDGLKDWIAFSRYLASSRTGYANIEEVCTDPSLGFIRQANN